MDFRGSGGGHNKPFSRVWHLNISICSFPEIFILICRVTFTWNVHVKVWGAEYQWTALQVGGAQINLQALHKRSVWWCMLGRGQIHEVHWIPSLSWLLSSESMRPCLQTKWIHAWGTTPCSVCSTWTLTHVQLPAKDLHRDTQREWCLAQLRGMMPLFYSIGCTDNSSLRLRSGI